MADVRKTVEIALQVVGIDTKNITALTTAFTGVQKAIDKTTSKISGLQQTLNSLKAPASLSKVIESLKQLDTIKAPNLTNIANGFQKLSKMEAPPDLTSFVRELQKFANIKLPGVTALVNGFKKLTEINVNAVVSKIKALNTALSELDKRGGISAFKNFARDVSQLKTAFNAAASSTQKMVSSLKKVGDVAQASGVKLRTFGDKVRTVMEFRGISMILLSVKDAFFNGITAIMEYDQALKDLQAITGATSLEVAQMGIKILEVASTTKFSASEVAEGMRIIGQAGFSASEAVETMQAVSDLATGTLSTMATTVDLVTTAMRVFQIDASESATVADVFANAVNKSKLTIDKLRTSMNYIGPIAKAAGVTFTELAAAMGTLANSGLRASTIGTGLRRVFAELIDPSKKLKEAANNAGVALAELDPRSADLSDVIRNLGLVVNDAQVAFDIFGKRGAAAALALSNTESGFQQMLITVGKSGTAAHMAAIQMEGLGVSFKNLKDKIGILAIAIGDAGISGIMRVLIDVSRNLIDVFTALISSTFVKFILKAGAITLAIIGISKALLLLGKTAAFTTLVTVFKEIASMAILAETSVLGLAATMAPIILTVAALTAATYLLFNSLGSTKEASEDAAKLADKYGILNKKFQDYQVATTTMVEGSDELSKANKDLRDQLLKTANGFTELSSFAAKAAASIDPVTGTILDGTKALTEYNDELAKVQYETLIKAGQSANNAIKEQTGYINRYINKLKDFGTQTANLFTGKGMEFIDFGKQAYEAEAFAKQISKGTVSFKELNEYIQRLDHTKLTSQQKDIIEGYKFINDQSSKFVDHLIKTNKIGLDDTIENIQQVAKDAGYTGLALDAITEKIQLLQKANEKSFSNIIEKWAVDGPDAINSFIDEYKKLGGVFSEGEEAQIRASALTKQSLVARLQALKNVQKAEAKAGVDIELTWKRYYAAERKLLKDASDVRQADSENASAQNIKLILHEKDVLAKEIAKFAVIYKNNAELRVKYQEEATRKYLVKEKRLLEGVTIDPKIQQEAYKASLGERETAFAKHLDNLALQEAKGVLSAKQAQEQKFQSTIDFYKESYAEAVRYQNSIDKLESPEAYEKATKEVLAKEKAYYKIRTKMLIEYNADIVEANKKIADADNDVTDENEKNLKNRIDNAEAAKDELTSLEVAYADKIEAINKALAKKLQTIDTQIADNRKKAKSDILSLESSTEEKIRNVRKKGMSDIAKDASDQEAANKYLREGRLLLAEADEEKDKEKLDRGTDLIKQSESLAGGLKNENEAIRLLKKSLESLKDARNIQAELKELDLLKKKNEEIAAAAEKEAAAKKIYDDKVTAATTAYDAIIIKEDERHKKEMTNLQKEIDKWEEKLSLATQRVETVVKDDPNSVKIENQRHETEMENIQTETNALMEKYETARKELEEYGLSQEELDMDFDTFFNSLTDTAGIAKDKVNEIMDEEVVIETDNTELEETVTIFERLDEFTKKALDLVVKVFGYKDVLDMQKAFDKLRDKTITITTKYVSTGTAPLRRAIGGKIPGYGGGDKNPVLAEDGEWFIRKEAVRKYGDGFMSMINNMSLPKFEFGGAVGGASINPASNPLANFGKVQLDTGQVSVPALISKETFADLATQLSNAKRFAV